MMNAGGPDPAISGLIPVAGEARGLRGVFQNHGFSYKINKMSTKMAQEDGECPFGTKTA